MLTNVSFLSKIYNFFFKLFFKNLVAPYIDRKAVVEIKIKAGQSFKCKIPVIGEPVPTVEWEVKGNPLVNTDRIKIVNKDYLTKLSLIDAKRLDAGEYKIIARNINGVDQCTFKVQVLDVPSPPEGPLKIDNITRSSCTLQWRTPKDDGGSEILHYTLEKLDSENMRWLPVGETRDLVFTVDRLIENHDYNFRVIAVNKQGESLPLTCQNMITAKDPFNKPGKPGTPQIKDWDKDHVDIEWTKPNRDGGSPITSFIIEKRRKNLPWQKALEVAGNVTSAQIPDLVEGDEYEFRVIAVNKSGPGEPSEPSESVIAKTRFLAPKIDLSAMQDMIVKVGNRISFSVPYEAEPKPTIEWTINENKIEKNTRIEINSTSTLINFDIASATRADTGNYKLQLSNNLGSVTGSANVKVVDRPSAPKGPLNIGRVTKESAIISWNIPDDDGGAPILHYVIEKMDLSRGIWSDAGMCTSLSCEVTRLTHLKEYMFRVKAVNSIGESLPLETTKSIIAKNEFDEPSAPGKPQITDWDKDRIDLAWSRSLSDGGSPITGYIVQKKEKGNPYWSDAIKVAATNTKCSVPNLKEGQEYEFRIIAVNSIGNSEPSEPSDTVMAKSRNLAPKIISILSDIRIKAGLILHADINFVGEPLPEVIWTTDQKLLETDSRTTITSIGYHTVVHKVNVNRQDSGIYELLLKNKFGEDKGLINVTVVDRPGPPVGPLDYEEVTATSVTLSWKPPKDNGGSEITGYIIEKRDLTHGGGWVPAVTYVQPKYNHSIVPRLLEGTKYEFRVSAENLQGRSDPLVTEKSIIAKNQYDVPGKPGKPELISSDKDHIGIKWSSPISNGGSPILGYTIERRDWTTGRWVKLNKEPINSLEFFDNDVIENQKYEYRVSALNAAGVGKPSDSSKAFIAKPMKEKPKLYLDALLGRKIKVCKGEPINITIPISGAPTPQIEWDKDNCKIPQSNRISMETSNDCTKFSIESSLRSDAGNYTITASNEYGVDSADITVIVVSEPDAPKGPIQYSAITQNSVTLSWNAPDDDGGGEITGYIVEMSEADLNIFKPISGFCPRTSFLAKGLVEGKKYVFRVKAENIYGISEHLEGKPVLIKSPFDVPDAPSQPKIISYSPSNCSIAWEPPISTGGKPITGYYVEKRERGGDWFKVNNYPTPNTCFTITDLKEGGKYEFRVKAVNEAGEGKPSKPTDTITAEHQRFCPDAPDQPKADRITKNSITLSWRAPRNDGGVPIKGYILQMKSKSDKWSDLNTALIPTTIHTVPNLVEFEEYQFRVIAVNDVGQSKPSRPSSLIKIEEQPNKPCIDLGAVRDIIVRACEDFSIHVPYIAFPKPTLSWFANDSVLDDSDSRVFQQLTDDSANIVVQNAKRSDSGQYRLQLRNQSGFDTATINVKVLDKPSKPENLHAEEFAGDAFTLFWSPPKDNGGADITNYIVEKKEPRSPVWTKISGCVTVPFCRIKNLTPGNDYEFRVFAENQYGQSEPAISSNPIKARYPFDIPGAPGAPRGIESTDDSITIQWTKPIHDGGSPITGYVVEKRLISEDKFIKASHVHILDLNYKVPNLLTKHEYEFRVAAINAAGQGPWSQCSDLILCSAPPFAPKITSDLNIRDMTVIAGEEFNITVPFVASPRPKPNWTINGREIFQDERVKFPITDNETVYHNKCAKRSDSGNYTIRLINSEGSDTASCKILVVDKPLTPQGPIDVTEITPDSCTLTWKPPLDDGGSPISNYTVEKLDQNGVSIFFLNMNIIFSKIFCHFSNFGRNSRVISIKVRSPCINANFEH